MSYVKQTWQDGNPAYPPSAARFGHMEDGIEAAATAADSAAATADAAATTADSATTTANTALTTANSAATTANAAIPKPASPATNDALVWNGTGWTAAKLTDASIDAAAAIAYSKLDLASSIVNADVAAGAAIAPSKIAFASVNTFTPSLTATTTSPTLGTGSVAEGQWIRAGNLVQMSVRFKFGTAGVAAGSGIYEITLPVATAFPTSGTVEQIIGSGWVYDASSSTIQTVLAEIAGAGTKARLRVMSGAGIIVQNSAPWTWATLDQIAVSVVYPAS